MYIYHHLNLLISIPSSSLATIKFTKSMARAAMYVGLNAVNTVFNNNDLKKIYIYICIKTIENEIKHELKYIFTHFLVFYNETKFPREDFRAMLLPKPVQSNPTPVNRDSNRNVE